jgi:hypothetical protein
MSGATGRITLGSCGQMPESDPSASHFDPLPSSSLVCCATTLQRERSFSVCCSCIECIPLG